MGQKLQVVRRQRMDNGPVAQSVLDDTCGAAAVIYIAGCCQKITECGNGQIRGRCIDTQPGSMI